MWKFMAVGRPKNDPIVKIRAQAFVAYACHLLGIDNSGYLLNEHLQQQSNGVQTSHNNKWERIKRGDHLPSLTSRNEVYHAFGFEDELEPFFNHPIWSALKAKNIGKDHWQAFYRILPLDIQYHIFSKNTESDQSLNTALITSSKLKQILMLWNDDAFACLIALCRDKSIEFERSASLKISFYVSKYLEYWLRKAYLRDCANETWQYFQRYIVPGSIFSKHDHTLWQGGFNTLHQSSQASSAYFLIAEDLGLIRTPACQKLYFYWKTMGNIKRINEELLEAYNTTRYKPPDTELGLKWLIQKMNQHLPKKQQINDSLIG